MPEVSVLMPYRDAEPTLEQAVRSILEQRGVSLELLAIDDGSRDGGAALMARIAAADPRVRLLSSAGAGIATALELGLAGARAELCARMDADDVSLPGRLAAQRDALANDPSIAVLGCQVEAFPTSALGEGMRRYLDWQNALTSAADHRRQLFVESPLCHPSVMLRRDMIRRLGGYRQGAFPEDYDLWLRAHAAGHGLAKLPRVLLRWRQGAGRATFADARYARERFIELKAPHVAREVGARGRELWVWGAGKTGKRLARALEGHGVRAARFIDIDPHKIGRQARGAPIVGPEVLGHQARSPFVLVAVGARGARDLIRAHLEHRGLREGHDYLCAS